MIKNLSLTIVTIFLTTLAHAQNRIRVSGVTHTSEFTEIAISCLNQLEIEETVYLTIEISRNMPFGYQGITIPVSSPYPDVPIFRIMIDKYVSNKEQKLILVHEMIHVKQYIKKELVIIDDSAISWNGMVYHYHPANNRKMPWEVEAYANDQELVRLITAQKNRPAHTEQWVVGEVEKTAEDIYDYNEPTHILFPTVVTQHTAE